MHCEPLSMQRMQGDGASSPSRAILLAWSTRLRVGVEDIVEHRMTFVEGKMMFIHETKGDTQRHYMDDSLAKALTTIEQTRSSLHPLIAREDASGGVARRQSPHLAPK